MSALDMVNRYRFFWPPRQLGYQSVWTMNPPPTPAEVTATFDYLGALNGLGQLGGAVGFTLGDELVAESEGVARALEVVSANPPVVAAEAEAAASARVGSVRASAAKWLRQAAARARTGLSGAHPFVLVGIPVGLAWVGAGLASDIAEQSTKADILQEQLSKLPPDQVARVLGELAGGGGGPSFGQVVLIGGTVVAVFALIQALKD